jgi:tyrosine-protein kinase
MSSSSLGSKWFHGRITRDNACHLLSSAGQALREGYFLVRESTHRSGDFVVSVVIKGEIQHFQVLHRGDAWYSIDNGPVFQGLDELVKHYQASSNGLPIPLGQPVLGQAPPSHTLKRYNTELHRAVLSGNADHVRTILTGSKNTGLGTAVSRNEDGSTPLHLAAEKGDPELVEVLLKHGADTSIRDSTGTTALHVAVRSDFAHIVRLLVEVGRADVQERNSSTGWVALHEAAFRGHLESARMLIFLNAPIQPRTQEDDFPRDLAHRYGKKNVVELLDYALTNYPLPRTNSNDWLHKRCDRQRAVLTLREKGGQDGHFLVRPHSTKPNHYALTAMYQNNPYHFEIICRNDRVFYIDDGPCFTSLTRVIEHYMMFADGLPTKLLYPVPPLGSPPPRRSTAPPPGEILFPNLSNKPCSPKFQKPPPVGPKPGSVTAPPVGPKPGSVTTPPVAQTMGNPQFPPPVEPPCEELVSSLNLERLEDKLARMEIDPISVKLTSELGSGEFSLVLKGKWRQRNGIEIDVAVKKLKPNAISHGEPEFLREAAVMCDLDHHCIVKFLGVCRTKPVMLVQELVPLGSLLNYLYNSRDTPRQPDCTTLKLWAAEIACGMVYLEQKRFVHRDLAARNILISSMKQVKISDFGLSRTLGAHSNYYQASQGGKWPVKWYAPESVNFGTFSSFSDVWSYGVTLWEMFSYGDHPYGDLTGTQVLEMVEERGYRLSRPKACPGAVYDIMLLCWSLEPTNRPTFAKLHSTMSNSDEYKSVPHSELYAIFKRNTAASKV